MNASISEASSIITAMEGALEEIRGEFEDNPSHFFTENDLVCLAYKKFLAKYPNLYVRCKDGRELSILHTEFPTPFRCLMKEKEFTPKTETERTVNRRGYSRGKIDLVVLNPELLKKLTFEEARFQDNDLAISNVLPYVGKESPMILYGVEFMHQRYKLSLHGAWDYSKDILQDHQKLFECMTPSMEKWGCPDFLLRHKTMVFFQMPDNVDVIEDELVGLEDIMLIYPKAH